MCIRDRAKVDPALWSITDEDGKAVTELTAGTLYELRVTVADGGALDPVSYTHLPHYNRTSQAQFSPESQDCPAAYEGTGFSLPCQEEEVLSLIHI